MTEVEKFFAQVEYSENCWNWTGGAIRRGYGQFYYKGKTTVAHRWSYSYFVEPVDANFMVCHHCDNPRCVNPFHLYMGTAKDNAKDAVERRRHVHVAKDRCPNGHEYKGDNLKVFKGWRYCRQCSNEQRNNKLALMKINQPEKYAAWRKKENIRCAEYRKRQALTKTEGDE